MVNPFDPARLIQAAQAAPSILNTQPWFFYIIDDDLIELRATPIDIKLPATPIGHKRRERHLKISDRQKREMVISCGAALYSLCLAIRVTGHTTSVHLVPDEEHDPDLLARVEIDIDHVLPGNPRGTTPLPSDPEAAHDS